jgi:hypothetical protein
MQNYKGLIPTLFHPLFIKCIFTDRELRKLFRTETDSLAEGGKFEGELHNLYSFPSIVRKLKSRRVRCEGHIKCMGEERNAYKMWLEKLRIRS